MAVLTVILMVVIVMLFKEWFCPNNFNQCNYEQEAKTQCGSEYIEVDTTKFGHEKCELKSGWFCPGIGFVDLPCNYITKRCFLKSKYSLSYVGCEYKNVCLSLSNRTVCKKWNTK